MVNGDVPYWPVTRTSTVPVTWRGETATIEVGDTTVKLVAGTPPKVTALTLRKRLPVIVTDVPPPPELFEIDRRRVVGLSRLIWVLWALLWVQW